VRSSILLALAVLLPGVPVLAQQQQPVPIAPVQQTQPTRGAGMTIQGAAVWLHPTVPASSLLLVADNQIGLLAYNLDGSERGLLVPGALTGVDVREGFPVGTGTQSLVMLANASVGLLGYVIDPSNFSARSAGIRDISTGFAPTAVALYRSPRTQRFYAFAASAAGSLVQYDLGSSADAGTTTPVRTLNVGGPVLSLAVDDALGALYVVQQDVGIWRYGAEPDATDSRISVDSSTATPDGGLVRPLGGVALYTASNDRGYLLAVSGGENAVRVYDRSLSAHTYRGRFSVVADGGIDAVENSRLVVVTNRALGPLFSQGLVAVHDGANIGGNENFKLLKWPAVAEGLTPPLIVDNAPPLPPSDGGTPDAGEDGGSGPLTPGRPGGGIGVESPSESCGCSAASLPGSVLLGLAGVLLLSRRRSRD
jgi:3-phytase